MTVSETETEESRATRPLRGRPTKLTYELVDMIATRLAAANGHFTCSDVLNEIGEGSMTTVHRLLKKWRDQNPLVNGKAMEVSAKFLAALNIELSRQIDAAVIEYKDELAAARTDNDHLCSALEIQRDRVADIEHELTTMSSSVTEKNSVLQALRAERVELKAEIKHLVDASWISREKLLLSESKLQNSDALQSELIQLKDTIEKLQEQGNSLRADLAASKATTEQLRERLIELRPTQVSKPETGSDSANVNPETSASTNPKSNDRFPNTEAHSTTMPAQQMKSFEGYDSGNLDSSSSVDKTDNTASPPKPRGKRSKPFQKDVIIDAAFKMLESSPIVTSPGILAHLREKGFQVGGEEPIGVIAATLGRSKKFLSSKSPRGWVLISSMDKGPNSCEKSQ